jgi:dTDP-4-amino-4,6-dideoxygalactose transaminase
MGIKVNLSSFQPTNQTLKNKRIYLSPPSVDSDEERAVVDALRSGWVAPVGPELQAFETGLKEFFPKSHVVALNSGTAALHLAVKIAGVGKGDVVLIGSFTFVAAANVVLYEGAVPVFIDSENTTWNIDPDLLEQRLKKGLEAGEKIKAVIITHLYGMPAQIDLLVAVCKKYRVDLIEDAAEAFGASIHSLNVGGFGRFGVLSFNGNKIITTSGGGALVCENANDAIKTLHLSQQAKEQAQFYQHIEVGYNYRMSNLLAAVGNSQLKKLESFIQKKRAIYQRYFEGLNEFEVFDFLTEPEGYRSNCWLTTVLVKESYLPIINPQEIIDLIEKENIEARRLWKPLHLQPLFEGCESVGGHVCEKLFNAGFCLPSGVDLEKADQDRIIKLIQALLRSKGLLK